MGRVRVRGWVVLTLLALVPEGRAQDVKVYRAGGSGIDPVATVVQESAAVGGFDSSVYPHCVFVDNAQFGQIDASDDNTLSADELSNDGAGSMMSIMDANNDNRVDVLEFASGADQYLALKGIVPSGEPNENKTCNTCAPGWMGQHCNERTVPVEIKIAVRASQAYFSGGKQEALRRALALGVQWNQVRVVVKSVVTTETEGQLMRAELLAGGTVGRGDPKTAAVFLANAGSNFYQETLWESLWYLHVVCPTNCTVRVAGDTRTWRSAVSAKCTGPENQRIYALGQQDCENTRNDNSWLPAEVSRCEDRSAACKDADGNAVASQPADMAACLDVEGQTWEPTIISSDVTEEECTTPASGNLFLPRSNGVCVDSTASSVPTARVRAANMPQAGIPDSGICNADGTDPSGLTGTQFLYVADFCVNSEGEKANMPPGWLPSGARSASAASGPGQDPDLPFWFESDGQEKCEEARTTYEHVAAVEGGCIVCKDAGGLPIDPPEENADVDGIIRYKRDCEAVAGQSWELITSASTEQACEWIPRNNEWQSAIEPGCFSGEVQQPQYAVNITTENECVTAINTGTCNGQRGECDCAIGYEGVDCTIPIITSAQEEEPPDPFWLIVLYFASVTVAAPFCCASLITIWRKCSHPLNRVAPDEQKKDRSLFMPREARVASAQGVDVLNMVDLQPIAPTGGVAIGAQKKSGTDDEEGILKRFERERKHVSINRKVGAQFDLGYPT